MRLSNRILPSFCKKCSIPAVNSWKTKGITFGRSFSNDNVFVRPTLKLQQIRKMSNLGNSIIREKEESIKLPTGSAAISTFDMFSIGIGPSSSHTVGPMRAARKFAFLLDANDLISTTEKVVSHLYGSLALTGEGHATPKAVLMGLEGETPEGIDPDSINSRVISIRQDKSLNLFGKKKIPFESQNLCMHKTTFLPYHPNGMTFEAFDKNDQKIYSETFYSVGGGFFVDQKGLESNNALAPAGGTAAPVKVAPIVKTVPFQFATMRDIITICEKHKITIAEMTLENERTWRSDEEIKSRLLKIWHTMDACIQKGLVTQGILPGGLNVKRRAPSLANKLKLIKETANPYDWVSVWAMAVNEENAAGSRVVTAPTNGAAGIVPAVLKYYVEFCNNATEQGIMDFLMTAAVIGMLFKHGASISAAEVGCQGEVGVACSMAAGALTQVRGGTVYQIENAAEIGMEHNLGLTCDPIGGLVQIPCIERNVMGAVKAITSSRLALSEDGQHVVSLDAVIATVKATGQDMSVKYKETSTGGLAINFVDC